MANNKKASNKAVKYENGAETEYYGNVEKVPETPKYLNKTPKKNPHEGHRERLRERFVNEGLDAFEDHNVLELLLMFSIPVRDVNEDAHRLIEQFGSVSSVFDAKFSDLCKVKGIGEKSAILIKLMTELFRRYELDKLNKDDVVLNSAELVAKYISKYYTGVTEEKLYLICLDSNCRLLSCDLISSGTVNATPINNRTIAERAYAVNASNLILVHNHPSGISAPSRQDTDITMKLAETLSAIGLRLSDHIIIGADGEYFSFKKNKKWNFIFKN